LILVNNAGISFPVDMLETTVDQWNKVMSINVTSVFLGMKFTIPHMKSTGGSIVNISSIAGLTGSSGAGAYTASKGAVRMLTKAAAVDYGQFNIRVNSVHPGYIETPMSSDLIHNEQMLQWFLSQTALPRVGQASEVAAAGFVPSFRCFRLYYRYRAARRRRGNGQIKPVTLQVMLV
jgi:NAD(P)-dependent dehydrogenase (short-subunit alcohol dehydrogenase family)